MKEISNSPAATSALKPETLAQAPALIAQYPQQRSATMPLLHLVQEDRGYITQKDMTWVAELVGVTPMQVLEVVTFYPRTCIGVTPTSSATQVMSFWVM